MSDRSLSSKLNLLPDLDSLHHQAEALATTGDYAAAAGLYEQMLELDPEFSTGYWQLGLMYLLQGQEAEAQFTWMMPLAELESEQAIQWTQELLITLERAAQTQADCQQWTQAWLIRQHIQSIDPDNLKNLLSSLHLSLLLDRLDFDELAGMMEQLQVADGTELSDDLLLPLLSALLAQKSSHSALKELIQFCITHLQDRAGAIESLLAQAKHWGMVVRDYRLGGQYSEACLQIDPNHAEALKYAANIYRFVPRYEDAIQLAKRYYEECCHSLDEKLVGISLLLNTTMTSGGYWENAVQLYQEQQQLVQQVLQSDEPTVFPNEMEIATYFFYGPYMDDRPEVNRPVQNQFSQCCRNAWLKQLDRQIVPFQHHLPQCSTDRKLRIGYLSRDFRRHSIGWLARWLLRYHDPAKVEVYVYFLNLQQPGEFGETWYVKPATRATCISGDPIGMAQRIYEDGIDILIDVDSLSCNESNAVMALKPAPVQATWLGLDASGNPAIDYFIADPYVLPESAQDYYSERIWRLPRTYIAIDGFEVGVPTLQRNHLDIPDDAIIYFSSQTAVKRHPKTIQQQMQIICSVPNSYFVIKGAGDQNNLRNFFESIAETEGVAIDRLRFLPLEPLEETHRANLEIADVVLDTFPYNGATTTLETLWMGIPLVTQVGQQFAARNSYAMMMNAGITEGIAWSGEDYVSWGIRLGQDADLRETIAQKLKQSRQTAPLWNAEAFAREMENAYTQMWQIYTQSIAKAEGKR